MKIASDRVLMPAKKDSSSLVWYASDLNKYRSGIFHSTFKFNSRVVYTL